MAAPSAHRVSTVPALTSAEATALRALLTAAASADGIPPLNEDAAFALRPVEGRPARGALHFLVHAADGRPIGYAQLDTAHVGQLVVDPAYRRRGIGTALWQAVKAMDPAASVWSFGHIAAAQTFVLSQGLIPRRELLQMTRDLSLRPPHLVSPRIPVRIRPFQAADADALLAVNAAAFEDHPEQGQWTRQDLSQRLTASWFDPEGLLMAEDLSSGRVVGFHWTKIHTAEGREPVGEVYVLAVTPSYSGNGLGRALLEAGIDYLGAAGLRYIILYVEGSRTRLVRLYDESGFWVSRRDVLYGPASFADDDATVTAASGWATAGDPPTARVFPVAAPVVSAFDFPPAGSSSLATSASAPLRMAPGVPGASSAPGVTDSWEPAPAARAEPWTPPVVPPPEASIATAVQDQTRLSAAWVPVQTPSPPPSLPFESATALSPRTAPTPAVFSPASTGRWAPPPAPPEPDPPRRFDEPAAAPTPWNGPGFPTLAWSAPPPAAEVPRPSWSSSPRPRMMGGQGDPAQVFHAAADRLAEAAAAYTASERLVEGTAAVAASERLAESSAALGAAGTASRQLLSAYSDHASWPPDTALAPTAAGDPGVPLVEWSRDSGATPATAGESPIDWSAVSTFENPSPLGTGSASSVSPPARTGSTVAEDWAAAEPGGWSAQAAAGGAGGWSPQGAAAAVGAGGWSGGRPVAADFVANDPVAADFMANDPVAADLVANDPVAADLPPWTVVADPGPAPAVQPATGVASATPGVAVAPVAAVPSVAPASAPSAPQAPLAPSVGWALQAPTASSVPPASSGSSVAQASSGSSVAQASSGSSVAQASPASSVAQAPPVPRAVSVEPVPLATPLTPATLLIPAAPVTPVTPVQPRAPVRTTHPVNAQMAGHAESTAPPPTDYSQLPEVVIEFSTGRSPFDPEEADSAPSPRVPLVASGAEAAASGRRRDSQPVARADSEVEEWGSRPALDLSPRRSVDHTLRLALPPDPNASETVDEAAPEVADEVDAMGTSDLASPPEPITGGSVADSAPVPAAPSPATASEGPGGAGPGDQSGLVVGDESGAGVSPALGLADSGAPAPAAGSLADVAGLDASSRVAAVLDASSPVAAVLDASSPVAGLAGAAVSPAAPTSVATAPASGGVDSAAPTPTGTPDQASGAAPASASPGSAAAPAAPPTRPAAVPTTRATDPAVAYAAPLKTAWSKHAGTAGSSSPRSSAPSPAVSPPAPSPAVSLPVAPPSPPTPAADAPSAPATASPESAQAPAPSSARGAETADQALTPSATAGAEMVDPALAPSATAGVGAADQATHWDRVPAFGQAAGVPPVGVAPVPPGVTGAPPADAAPASSAVPPASDQGVSAPLPSAGSPTVSPVVPPLPMVDHPALGLGAAPAAPAAAPAAQSRAVDADEPTVSLTFSTSTGRQPPTEATPPSASDSAAPALPPAAPGPLVAPTFGAPPTPAPAPPAPALPAAAPPTAAPTFGALPAPAPPAPALPAATPPTAAPTFGALPAAPLAPAPTFGAAPAAAPPVAAPTFGAPPAAPPAPAPTFGALPAPAPAAPALPAAALPAPAPTFGAPPAPPAAPPTPAPVFDFPAAVGNPPPTGPHPTVSPDTPPPPPSESPLGPAGARFSDRELSWLAFNSRVLDLAKDRSRVPLLERAKFLAIFSSNLDEFFMVRVGGLKRRIEAGMAQPGTSGLLPRELHDAILSTTRDLVAEQGRIFTQEIRPELAQAGIHILHWSELTEIERERLDALFRDRIFPILTPLAIDPSHPFPHLSARSLNLIVQEQNPQTGVKLFARVKVPDVLPRFYRVSEDRYVPLEDILLSHQDAIFGMTVLDSTICRVTRDEDVEVEEDDAENILFALEKEISDRRRPGRPPVRLELSADTAPVLLDFLVRELDITTQEAFFINGPVDLRGLFAIADVDREDLKYTGFLPKTNPQLSEFETARPANLFAVLKKRDVLLHHPYDSFATSVQRFLEQAAADPRVKLIRQTLYRTSGDSPIVDALVEAAQAGKEVLALIEIKARFDEQANIRWARKLERAGVHVVYGVVGFKTHCKLCLVIREDEDGVLRRYCHIGTGNYNPKTARLYEDMGLLTSDPSITGDVHQLFNSLASATVTVGATYHHLLVSPRGIRDGLLRFIDREIALQQSGVPGRIRIKVNSIVDEATMDALYRASQAGVQVDLWVRGICALRAGIPGLSENIRVRSILGRFLEHSRLFWFDNGGQPMVGIGSSDLMHRNLDRRVEVVVQIGQEEHIQHIGHLFDLAFDDKVASWWLTPDGWVQRTADEQGNPLIDLQQHLVVEMATRRSA